MADEFDKQVSVDMARHVRTYINKCREHFAVADRIWIEEKVGMPSYIKYGFGTVDCGVLVGDNLYLYDLKYGKGIQVWASTPQAAYYAVCIIDTYNIKPKKIVSTIVQPRLNHIDEHEYTYKQILEMANTFKKGAKRVAKMDRIVEKIKAAETEEEKSRLASKLEFAIGDHCGFCKAKVQCKARAAYIEQEGPLTTIGFTEVTTMSTMTARDQWCEEQALLMNDEELAKHFAWCDFAARQSSAIKQVATQRVAAGKKLPGLKLVAGRSSRAWKDEVAAEFHLRKAGVPEDDIYKRSMISVSQAEKALGKKLGDDLVLKEEGKGTLVLESDRRKAIDPMSQGESENYFTEI